MGEGFAREAQQLTDDTNRRAYYIQAITRAQKHYSQAADKTPILADF
jgi:hypothetical protein